MYMRTIPSLRIIVAMVIAFESVISWMPMYGEIKLAFFVYLWYPKTKVLKFCSLREFLLIIMLLLYTPALEKFCNQTLSIESRSPFCCCPAQPRPINPNKDIALYGYGSIACKNRTEEWKRKQLHKLQKVSSDGGGPDGYDFDDDDIPMCDESRQQLSRKLPIASGKINPYRIVIILRLAILGLFFHYRIQNPVHDAYWLWLTSVICEIWFSFSWILDQFPKWYPIERETYLDRLSSRYEKEGKPSELAPIDIFVSTVDPMKEPPLITANTVLSILSVDYPIDKVACYVSDDGAAVLTFEAHTGTGVFARKWVPFCKKYKIEPRAPEWYFARKIDF